MGRVEEEGLRRCYHGYDTQKQCIELPCETGFRSGRRMPNSERQCVRSPLNDGGSPPMLKPAPSISRD